METQTELVVSTPPAGGYEPYDDARLELLRRTIARGATEDELQLFIEQCKRTQLDPFARQIYSVRRKQWNSQSRSYEEAQVIQVSIDGFRVIADRSREYAGQDGPYWCGPDGAWNEVWLNNEPPSAAKVGVFRQGWARPLYRVALFKAYAQTNAHGELISRWKTDPAGMLAKCAESLALRAAFPQDLSGLYTGEEMGQLDQAPALPSRVEPGIFLEDPDVTTTPHLSDGASEPEPEPEPEPITLTIEEAREFVADEKSGQKYNDLTAAQLKGRAANITAMLPRVTDIETRGTLQRKLVAVTLLINEKEAALVQAENAIVTSLGFAVDSPGPFQAFRDRAKTAPSTAFWSLINHLKWTKAQGKGLADQHNGDMGKAFEALVTAAEKEREEKGK